MSIFPWDVIQTGIYVRSSDGQRQPDAAAEDEPGADGSFQTLDPPPPPSSAPP